MCFTLTLVIYTNVTVLFYTLNRSTAIPSGDLQSYLTLDHSHQKTGWKCFFFFLSLSTVRLMANTGAPSSEKHYKRLHLQAQDRCESTNCGSAWPRSSVMTAHSERHISAVPCKKQALLHLSQEWREIRNKILYDWNGFIDLCVISSYYWNNT